MKAGMVGNTVTCEITIVVPISKSIILVCIKVKNKLYKLRYSVSLYDDRHVVNVHRIHVTNDYRQGKTNRATAGGN